MRSQDIFEKLVNDQIARSVGACLDEMRSPNPIRTFRRCCMRAERLAGDLIRLPPQARGLEPAAGPSTHGSVPATSVAPQVGSYRGYSGRASDVAVMVAHGPQRRFAALPQSFRSRR